MVLEKLEVSKEFNSAQSNGKKVSLADIIVLAGCAGVEKAAKVAGYPITVPFTPGVWMHHRANRRGFIRSTGACRRWVPQLFKNKIHNTNRRIVNRQSQLLTLSAPEMTVLVGGMRVLDTNFDNSKHGVLTERPEILTNDFFVNLLDMSTTWMPTSGTKDI